MRRITIKTSGRATEGRRRADRKEPTRARRPLGRPIRPKRGVRSTNKELGGWGIGMCLAQRSATLRNNTALGRLRRVAKKCSTLFYRNAEHVVHARVYDSEGIPSNGRRKNTFSDGRAKRTRRAYWDTE
ncbi:TPA: hypothetical protein DIS60_00790 [Patescibacteria group bacterium]|nr:hypothetical protein [Patescibacteria group bacterium]